MRQWAVPIGALKPDPANARRHPQRNLDAIAASLRRFGQQAPVVFAMRAGRRIVVKGNGLLAAARQLGWHHVAAVRSDLDAEALRAYAIADNRTGDLSEFDERLLAAQIRELEDASIDLEAVGFTDREMKQLLKRLDAAGAEGEEADAADESEPPHRARRISELHAVIVECRNEREQLAFYRRMKKEGRRCKLYVL